MRKRPQPKPRRATSQIVSGGFEILDEKTHDWLVQQEKA
jgi:hypothetical protein